MRSMTTKGQSEQPRRSESGMALILALMALVLLTAIGLTLATSTSTEVQVAANYRWSLQALYNAEAGIEVAKSVLRGDKWNVRRPVGRKFDPVATAVTVPPAGVAPDAAGATRDWEMGQCDTDGKGVGYGAVLGDDAAGNAPLENVTQYGGLPLNGAFTLWFRRPLVYRNDDPAGAVQDYNPDDVGHNPVGADDYPDILIVVSEGVAPADVSTFTAGQRAVQVVEATLYQGAKPPSCNTGLAPQYGAGQGGANMDRCNSLNVDGMVIGGIGAIGGGAGGGGYTRR